MTSSSWLHPFPRADDSVLRLIAFPYAGAGLHAYPSLRQALPKGVSLHTVLLPGRGMRLVEPPLTDMEILTSHLIQAIAPFAPCVFFGHSLGAFLAFETTRLLRQQGMPLPLKLIVSGQRAPHLASRTRPIHSLPRAEFIEELRGHGGTPEEILADTELVDMLLPMLRADFELCETYRYHEAPPLPVPILAFGGVQDAKADQNEISAWRRHTTAGFHQREFSGGHFFVRHSSVAAALARELKWLAS